MPSKKVKSGKAKSGSCKLGRGEVIKLLQSLRKHPSSSRGTILKHLDDRTCESLYEIIYNILNNPKVPSKKLSGKLAAHKKKILYIANPKNSPTIKKKYLAQMGGFPFTAILSTAIPLLISYLTRRK
jgi:hypothetical protein